MGTISLDFGADAGHPVSELLHGDNLEANQGTVPALVSDRLRNPQFVGPGDSQHGIARHWEPGYSNFYYDAHYRVVEGLSLSGTCSQLVSHSGRKRNRGLVQTGVWVRAGEELEVEVWARVQDRPTGVWVAIGPNSLLRPRYAEVRIEVDTGYWSCVRTRLTSPVTDDQAIFSFYLDGPGVVHVDQIHLRPAGAPQVREEVVACLAELAPTVLRFPGGCESAVYRWRNGIGPLHLRADTHDPVFKDLTSYGFGTGEYLELCQALGAVPNITVAIGNGSPEEAAEWAAWCAAWYRERGIEPPLIYWQIGNEVYGRWELGAMTAHQYAETLRAFVPGIRKAYPAARIVGIGVDKGNNDGDGYDPWRTVILEEAASQVDVLALQYYPGYPADERELPIFLANRAGVLAGLVREAIHDGEARDPGIAVAVTEWALWCDGGAMNGYREPTVAKHAIYAAEVLARFAAIERGLEYAAYYPFGPVCMVQVEGPRVYLGDAGRLFRLVRPMLPGRWLPLHLGGPELEPGLGALAGFAIEAGRCRWALIWNRSPEVALKVRLPQVPSQAVALVTDSYHRESRETTLAPADTVLMAPLMLLRLAWQTD